VKTLAIASLALAILSINEITAAAHSRSDVRTPAPEQPNLVFIMADDLGDGDLGCYGQRKIIRHAPRRFPSCCSIPLNARCTSASGASLGP
jgi:hypothetical protein